MKPRYMLLINQYLSSLYQKFGSEFYTINSAFGNDNTFSVHARSDICDKVKEALNELEIQSKEFSYEDDVDIEIINEIVAEEQESMIENPLLYDCVIKIRENKNKVIFTGFDPKRLKKRRSTVKNKLAERLDKERRILRKPIKFDESKMPTKYVEELRNE